MAVEIIVQHLRVKPDARILVSAESNAALNVIADRIASAGISIIRWGHPARLPESLEGYSPAGWRAKGVVAKDMFKRSPVVLASLSQCATSNHLGGSFFMLIIDEAAQTKVGTSTNLYFRFGN